MDKRILWVFIILLIPLFLYPAGSVGKISGRVIDKETGEPLPGVNIIIEGYNLGAATDENGYYIILDVPAGVYSLRASFIGYETMIVKDVRVITNLTTEINFKLSRTTLEFKEVVVTAQRPLVQKSATYSMSIATGEELENIPIRNIANIIGTMAGVVYQDGQIHIRGGREDEVKFFLNGVPIVDPNTNQQVVYVIPEALEELQVLTGGYTADVGGANSGVVSMQLRSGPQKFQAMVDLRTDGFSDPEEGKKLLNTYTYGHKRGIFTVGGPLLSNNIKFFLGGEYVDLADRAVRFSKGFKFENLVDMNPQTPKDQRDTVTVEYPNGFTPHQKDKRLTLNGTLTFDLPIKLNLGFAYTDRRYDVEDGNRVMLDVLNDRVPYNDLNSLLLTLKATKVLKKNSYIEFRASRFSHSRERGDSWFDHDWKKWYDSTAVAEYTDGEVIYRNAWRPKYDYVLHGFPFERNGTPNDFYFKRNEQYIGFAGDLVTQIGLHHEIKMGVDSRLWTVRYFDIAPSVMIYTAEPGTYSFETYGSIEKVPVNVWIQSGYVDAYGYDIYGNEINDKKYYYTSGGDTLLGYVDGPRKPVELAFYVNDKMEYDDIIINAGVRMDYFDTDDKELIDPASPAVIKTAVMLADTAWKKKDPVVLISPRIGVSFPVTEATVFYAQYGKFYQMPSFQNMYFSTYTFGRQIVQGGYYYINPIGFGLDPIKTTSYEIGFRQALGGVASIDITGFYKNVKGLVQVVKQLPSTPVSTLTTYYDRLVNGDFATHKGLEVRFNLRRWNHILAQIHYTYTDAEGTQSTSTSAHGALYFNSQMPTIVRPLEYSQRHTGSINLDYRFKVGEGGPLLSGLGINLLFQFSSGHPYTFVTVPAGGQVDPYVAGVDYMLDTRDRWPLEPINSSVTPWTFFTDLRIDKTVRLGGIEATFYVIVNNLTNRKNVINVFWNTGTPDDDGFLSDPVRSQATINAYGGDRYVEMYRIINLGNGQAYWDRVGAQLYGSPRQIHFGVKITL
ncbi:MAG: TonB-dependent receptor [Candidatus Marinimicrobia bacterium]|nr:TonB-dependent receptor [Candidatus Neomarinimicrobiota bacterium]